MHFSDANPRWLSFVFVAALLYTSSGGAQVVSTSAPLTRSSDLSGLYRLERPSSIAPSSITFLRLLPDGRSRVETLHIDGGQSVRASVKVGRFSSRPWGLKTVSPGASPQLCIDVQGTVSCLAFHTEMPRRDILLFAPGANWGEPTLILRREPDALVLGKLLAPDTR